MKNATAQVAFPPGKMHGLSACCALRRLQPERHLPVWNAGIHEFPALGDESRALIKTQRVGLRIEPQYRVAAPASAGHQEIKYGPAHAAAAPVADHRHASDMAIGQQASGTNGLPLPVARKHVQRYFVRLIPFQRFGHPLFFDEYRAAYAL
jgi:hypothetical protein